MFSKPAVSRRLEWIRRKVSASTQVDIESGPTTAPNEYPGKKVNVVGCNSKDNSIKWKHKGPRPRSHSIGDDSSYHNHGLHKNVSSGEGPWQQSKEKNHKIRTQNDSNSETVMDEEIKKESLLEKIAFSTPQLKAYLEQMYFVGVSPYQTERLQNCAQHNWAWWTVHLLQKVLFGVISFMSAWHSISNAKFCYIYFMSGIGLHNFVDFGFHLVSFLTKSQHIYTMTFQKKMVDKMLNSMNQYEHKYNNKTDTSVTFRFATLLGICTVLIVALRYLTDGIFEWSLKDLILENSAEFGTNAFVWNHENLTNKEDQIYEKYGEKITITTVAFGTYTFMADMSSGIQMDSIRNLFLLLAWNMYSIVNDFMKRLNKTTKNVSPNDDIASDELQANREACWSMYLDLKGVVADSNDVNDGMLKILHVDNLLLYAHFVTICITKSNTTMANIIYYLWTIAKSELTYHIAGLIAGFNDRLRKWIRNWGRHTGKINVDDETLDVNIILDELSNEPLGFGKGNFLIKPTFHFKFLGLVGSLALFLADERKKAE